MNLQKAVAKLHLEPGDCVIVNGNIIDPMDWAKGIKGPKDCKIFAVYPNHGQSLKNAFSVMLDEEFKKLSREKLKELLDAACNRNG